jgi:hypothetical protein
VTDEEFGKLIAAIIADACMRVNAVVASQPEGWQPIATAPKDVEALFWVIAKTAEEAYLDEDGHSIFTGGAPRIEKCKLGHWSSLSKATHWRPLPPPPAGEPK